MKHIIYAASVACLMSVPATAQDSDMSEGFNLIEEGVKLFFRGLSDEFEPQMEEFARQMEPALRGFIEEMGPAMRELGDMIGELDDYHAPEKLPNGDIIIRRKSPLALTEPEGEIDL